MRQVVSLAVIQQPRLGEDQINPAGKAEIGAAVTHEKRAVESGIGLDLLKILNHNDIP